MYHIEKNTVQETLIIPLYGRMICSQYYPHLFHDEEARQICEQLDYDFASKEKMMTSTMGLFGALEVAQRHFDLIAEIKAYLNDHPHAAVINMGCGLDDTFAKVDNGKCTGYNIDFADVITVRNELLPPRSNEHNIACDLLDFSWMDLIDATSGAVFFASGVFYYLKTDDLKPLFDQMAQRFSGGVLVFDSCNQRGASMMRKTWLKEAGITDVNAYFSLNKIEVLNTWSTYFKHVSAKSYMRGYRDIFHEVGLIHKVMLWFCDHVVAMKIIHIDFK